MRKMLLGGILFLFLFILLGCTNKYDAVLHSNASNWIDAEFLKQNMVKGAFYPEEEEMVRDETSPSSRTFIITEQEEFQTIFTEYPYSISFEEKMVILYIFTDVYGAREYYLRGISLKEETLTVKTSLQRRKVSDACTPFQRCFMLTMDKKNIIEVNFIFN